MVNENQAGFRKGYQTTDHIFTLNAIIIHTINVKKKPLFVCFMDFKKAFDKVSHLILWQKLIHHGIEGKFLAIVESMYPKVRSSVRSNEGLNSSCTEEALQHYCRRIVTLIARQCKEVKFFRNRFVFIFADIFNNDVD